MNNALLSTEPYDVVVIGGGIGGIYAVHKFREEGLRVVGIEGADGFGGVWYHNRYPGARVDLDSLDYTYYFSEELYKEWKWSERFATQPELLRYLNHVVERFDLRRSFQLGTWVTGAQWIPSLDQYEITTDDERTLRSKFIVMATGNLSKSRDLTFPGLDKFRGDWVQTSHWPQRDVAWAGRRVGVIGTGSSGIQTISAIAADVAELHVFQRTPNYSVPAVNGPIDEEHRKQICADVAGTREMLFNSYNATHLKLGTKATFDCSPQERLEMIETQWNTGGHEFSIIFADEGRDAAANEEVAEFVRTKIRETVKNPDVAESLCPYDHPVGTRRICLDTGYYECFNLPNVHLVDLRAEPIETITETGIKTVEAEYELDLIIFATGFTAFIGALDAAGIKNERGESPTHTWGRGPRTFLGLMTDGFPNLFVLTGPGSPSVLANLMLENEFHVDWLCRLFAHMSDINATRVEPTTQAVDAWTQHVTDVAKDLLVMQVRSYMVHVNVDGSRVFMPYIGGLGSYVRRANRIADAGYLELIFK